LSISYPAPVPSARPPRDQAAALLRTAVGDAQAARAFELLTRVAAAMLDAPMSLLTVLDADAPALLRVRGSFGLPPGFPSSRVLRSDDAPCREVLARTAPVVVDDVRHDGRASALPLVGALGIGAYLGVPLVPRADRVLGVLCVLDVVARRWTERDVSRLVELCDFAIGEIERLEELTRRRHAEDALRAREALFRAVFDQASQFMGVCAPDGVLLDANQSALDLVRADASDVVGHPFWRAPWWAWCSAQRAAVESALRIAADGRPTRASLQYLAPDGGRRPLELAATPVRDADGAVSFILVEGRDATAASPPPVRCADPTCAYADALGTGTASAAERQASVDASASRATRR